MLLSWFDATNAKDFGATLADFFIQKVPPTARTGDKAFAQKTEKILGKMTDQIVMFKRQHKLNIYTKAQLGNAFKWTLKDAGFAPDYIDELTKWLMLHLS